MSHCITQCAEFNAVSIQPPHSTADTCTGRNGVHTARNSSLLLLAGCISVLSVQMLAKSCSCVSDIAVPALHTVCTHFYLHNGQIEAV